MTQPAAPGPDQFDPATFTVVEPKAFEDLKVGDIFRAPSRTLTDAHATAFQAVSAWLKVLAHPRSARMRSYPLPHQETGAASGRCDPAGLCSLRIRIPPSNLWVTWAGGDTMSGSGPSEGVGLWRRWPG